MHAHHNSTTRNQALATGSMVERFEVVDLIGAGDTGYVYLAYDRALDRHVALREYLPPTLALRAHDGTIRAASSQEQPLYAAGLRSFASEALVLARMESPSLVKVLRYWEGNGSGYAAMPFYEGTTLRRAADEHRLRIDDISLRMLLAQLLDAVEAVHRAQSCHGNISPSDILIRSDGRPLLLEFNAARTIIAEMTDTLPAVLKPGYAPVELYPGMADLQPGAWSDIYALAAVAYSLITGKAPPPAPQRLERDTMRPAREAGHGKYSPALLEAIDRSLAPHPRQRPASVADMRGLIGNQGGMVAFPQRADHAREAIRRDRETLQTVTANPAPAAAPQPTAAPVPPAARAPAPAMPAAAAAAAFAAPAAAANNAPSAVQAQGHHAPVLPPLQGEWRRPVIAGERRQFAPRRRRLPAVLIGAATLAAGMAAGVVVGYPELLMPQQAEHAPASASQAPPAIAASSPTPEQTPAAAATDLDAALAEAVSPAVPADSEPPAPAQERAPEESRARESVAPPAPVAAAATRPAAVAATAKPAAAADSRAAEEARLAAEQEEWRIASSIDKAEFYETYLKRFPDGRNAPLARARLEAAALGSGRRPAAAPAPATATAVAAVTAAPATPVLSIPQPPAAAPSEPPSAPINLPDAGQATAAAASPSRPTIRAQGQTLSGDFAADPVSGVLSGSGEVVWSNGDRYEGKLVNGSKEGKGKFVWSNGQRYDGDWANNQPNGRGAIVYANGNRYEGDVRDGLPNGRGTLTFTGGTRYEGDIRNGVPHGRGVMVFADGTRYEGDVRDGAPHGQGVTRFRNGDVYSGTVAKGRGHGQGRFSWANGTVWEGEFRDGQRTANGRMIAQTGSVASSGSSSSVLQPGR